MYYRSHLYESHDKWFTIMGFSLGHAADENKWNHFCLLCKGTGLVHTAPAHGPKHYLMAFEHSILIVSRSSGLTDFCFREFFLCN
jgi:isoleucyl-tRNA synthetase